MSLPHFPFWPDPPRSQARLLALVLAVVLAHAWVLGFLRLQRPPVVLAPPAMRWTLQALAPASPALQPGAQAADPQGAEVAKSKPRTQPGPLTVPAVGQRSASARPLAVHPAESMASAAPPTPVLLAASAQMQFTVQGRVRGKPISGQSVWVWQHDGQRYEARTEVGGLPSGTRVQSSVGAVGAEGLRPERYADTSRSERAAHFEREQGQVVFSANRPAAALQDGMQDRLSVVFQLAGLLAAAPTRYAQGTVVVLPVVSPREAQSWRFVVGQEERLELPGATLSARRLTRSPQREYEPTIDLWFAPAHGFAPVRMRVTQANGDFVDQLWQSANVTH